MPSVLFVCTGNIHRSPMAEAMFKAKVVSSEEEPWQVESAGTWAPAGEPAHFEPLPDAGLEQRYRRFLEAIGKHN